MSDESVIRERLLQLAGRLRTMARDPAPPRHCWVGYAFDGTLVAKIEAWDVLRRRWKRLPAQMPARVMLVIDHEPREGVQIGMTESGPESSGVSAQRS